MKIIATMFVLCGLMLLRPVTAHADYLYQYVGATFNYAVLGDGTSVTPPSENITATIDSSSMLAPNTTYNVQNPSLGGFSGFNSYSVALGGQSCAASDVGCGVSLSVTTNSSGAISSWTLGLQFPVSEPPTIVGSSTAKSYVLVTDSSLGPVPFDTAPLYDAVSFNGGVATPNYADGSTTPGTWSVSTVPLPASVWLLLGGLCALGLLFVRGQGRDRWTARHAEG